MSFKIPHCFKCNKCGLEIEYEMALEMECGECSFDEREAIYEDKRKENDENGEY